MTKVRAVKAIAKLNPMAGSILDHHSGDDAEKANAPK